MLNDCSAIKRIFSQLIFVLSPKQKRRSLVVFFAMILTSCLELLGVSAIYPLLQMMISINDAKNRWYINWVYKINPNFDDRMVLLVMCFFIILVFILKNCLAVYFEYLQFSFATDFQKEASSKMLEKYLSRPYEYFINTNSSLILRGINNDTVSVYIILLYLFQVAGQILSISLIACFLLIMDFPLAIGALAISGLCFIFIIWFFKPRIKRAGKLFREANAAQIQYSYQAINGVKEIIVLDRKEIFVKRFMGAASQYARSQLTYGIIESCPNRILEGVCISGFLAIICFRLIVGENASEFIPVLGSFAMAAFSILPSISKLSTRINSIAYHQFGLQSCYDNFIEAARIEKETVLRGEVDYQIDQQSICQFNKNTQRTDLFLDFKNKITIDDISWKYHNSNDYILHNLSMEIKKGESIALIGASGAGKTTLADIIMGLLKPQVGDVLLDGKDIFSSMHDWHRLIGYVPQSVYLIDDTIRANIAFGLSENSISDEKIWYALEMAQLKSFVESLPNSLDTIVGERGIKFSGGQKQRIAIARALYENPEILVLDEATSALDGETESAVMESIDALHGHKTLIIIAHRLSTIRNCDRVYEITEGIAIERNKTDLRQ